MMFRFTHPSCGPRLPEMDPVRKYVLLVLWQAEQDQASEIHIGGPVTHEGVPVQYLVDGTWYDITPFPAHIRVQVLRRIFSLGGQSGDACFPWEGQIDQDLGEGTRLRWRVSVDSAQGDAHFWRSIP
jgi:type II secretory ATPase GspE/PulE/Tfp pilus assembly ATPase PilB-like protein